MQFGQSTISKTDNIPLALREIKNNLTPEDKCDKKNKETEHVFDED